MCGAANSSMADNNKFVNESPEKASAIECTDDFDPLSGDIECVEEQIEGQLTAPDENLWALVFYVLVLLYSQPLLLTISESVIHSSYRGQWQTTR